MTSTGSALTHTLCSMQQHLKISAANLGAFTRRPMAKHAKRDLRTPNAHSTTRLELLWALLNFSSAGVDKDFLQTGGISQSLHGNAESPSRKEFRNGRQPV